MKDAYRDDLAAAQARVRDLEREADRLRTRNAELEAIERQKREAREKAHAPVAPAADRGTPGPTTAARTLTFLTRVCIALGLIALGASRYHQQAPSPPHPILAVIFFALAFVFWCCSGFRSIW